MTPINRDPALDAALEAREVRQESELLLHRSAEACRKSLALAERVARACARSRATRLAVLQNRLRWHAWRAGVGAAFRHASERGQRCTMVECRACHTVCFASSDRDLPLGDVRAAAAAVWIEAPAAVLAQLRMPESGLSVVAGECRRCASLRAGGATAVNPSVAAGGDLASTLLCVLGEISANADEIAARQPEIDEQAALARAFEDAIDRLAGSVSPDELPQFAEALDALLAQLRSGEPSRRGAAAPRRQPRGPRSSHFRPALQRD